MTKTKPVVSVDTKNKKKLYFKINLKGYCTILFFTLT